MNNNTVSMASCNPPDIRLGPPPLGSLSSLSNEPIAGPSGLPPVQQVPLVSKYFPTIFILRYVFLIIGI